MWQGKRILVGITGGIAAYKIPNLVRELTQLGADVKCIMTPASLAFVTPLTLATLTKNEVNTELYNPKTGVWTNHVELALWADIFIIAPLTASSLAKMAVGHSDNLLLTTYLSSKCPVFVAPAMDLDMFEHPSTQENFAKLRQQNVNIIPSPHGELASGLVGKGRMEEPASIIDFVAAYFEENTSFKGSKVLITAGPTYEAIDPVRFIGNHSSGKMGAEIALAFAKQGADVLLILGTSSLSIQHPNIEIENIVSAQEMLDAVKSNWKSSDIGVFAAAVSDYRPKTVAEQKIKKSEEEITLTLQKNPDILKWAGENKAKTQFLMGFALETNNEMEHATRKLKEKNLDLIALNSLANQGAGFKFDTNQITLVEKDNKFTNFELLSKKETANKIVAFIKEKLNEN